MDQLLSFLQAVNPVVAAAFCGALGGLIGALIGQCCHLGRLSWLPIVLAVAVFCLIPRQLVATLSPEDKAARAMAKISEYRLFALIFEHHPEARQTMEARIQQAVRGSSADQAFFAGQAAGQEIVSKYFDHHLPAASPDAIHRLLRQNISVMKKLQHKPGLCVTYFMGNRAFKRGDFSEELIKKELELKADILEEAINNPTGPPRDLTPETIVKVLTQAYINQGYDPADMGKADAVPTLPPAEGCRIGIEFSDALASMDPELGSLVFKNLMSLAPKS